MSQPHYTIDAVMRMSDADLSAELLSWANARAACNPYRIKQGKDPLDTLLLYEAAARLQGGSR